MLHRANNLNDSVCRCIEYDEDRVVVRSPPIAANDVVVASFGSPHGGRGATPFETCESTLRLAEELGVGTRDLKRIEVIGERIADVVFNYRKGGTAIPRMAGGDD